MRWMRLDVGVVVTRRRGTPVSPHVLLTDRDVAILRDLVRFGALTIAQVAVRHFGAENTARRRLAALADVGLPAGRLTSVTLAHYLAVADLAEHLLTAHPGASWVTERELRRDGMAAVRDRGDGRLLEGLPHVPNGVLVLGDGSRVAVELEASPKRQSPYERIFAWYAGTFDYAAVRWFCLAPAVEARLRKLVERQQMVEGLPTGVRASPP